ncbi:hypothetical protein [Nocardiopsis sp. NRRL B-16309]|uniref:hypothetical protein n=1 Tax=Nocardiopsis sp. NRRL B-16309 TaxID=1519494 RepID=UPI000A5026BE|nr:hypothetical protein [Nocardiopsis sp. NRRL B-16309]
MSAGHGVPEDPCPSWCEADHGIDTERMRHLRLVRDRGEEGVSVWLTRSDSWAGRRGLGLVEVTVWGRRGGYTRTSLEPSMARLLSSLADRCGHAELAAALDRAADLLDGASPIATTPA